MRASFCASRPPSLLLLAALALSLAACGREAPAPADETPGPGADAAAEAGSPADGADAPTREEGESDGSGAPLPGGAGLDGRLVLIAAGAAPGGNGVFRYDPEGGERARLWDTGPEVTDWSVAPGGARAAYRASEREPVREALVLRELRPEAPPRELAAVAVDTESVRLAGYAWSTDGDAIAYGRQIGAPQRVADGEPYAWELHIAGATPEDAAARTSNDRLVWRAEGEALGPVALSVAGWAPERGLAVLRETAGDGGPDLALRVIDTGIGQEVARWEPPVPGARPMVAPGALRAAWLGPDGRIDLLDVESGEVTPWIEGRAGLRVFGALWSPDGERLAWSESEGEALEETAAVRVARALPAEADGARFAREGDSLRPLAFAPEGERLLLVAAPAGEVEGRVLLLADPSGGRLDELPQRLPTGHWGAAWLADRAAARP